MSNERDGIEVLRKAIAEVAERLPARSPARRVTGISWTVVAASVIAAAAIAAYRLVPRPVDQAAPASFGVEVKLLRVRGQDVGVRVFDAARAGTVVVAPAIGRKDVPRPVGAIVLSKGGAR